MVIKGKHFKIISMLFDKISFVIKPIILCCLITHSKFFKFFGIAEVKIDKNVYKISAKVHS